jgi:hypothetical protein
MDNRQRLIGMIKGNKNALFIYVQQPDGKYKYFDMTQKKTIGQSLTLSQLRTPSFICDEGAAMIASELQNL